MYAQDIYKKFFSDNPVVAHRGAWKTKGIPQNSIESLREAMRLGCAGSEFDIHMTADSVFVLCHDSNYSGMVIEKHTYAELAKIKLPNGETIPTLEQVLLEGMKQTGTRLFLEIKPSSTVERTILSAEKTVKIVNETGAQPWIFYISFSYEAVKRIKQLTPSSVVAYLGGDVSPEQLKKDGITGLDYHHSTFKKDVSMIETARELGLSLNVWTVNSSEDMDLFMSHNVDYITTDAPELLLGKMKESEK
ncbi:MAG: glycerophosphodiester phosphodiesterase [Prevotellaceae bacterium]|jgi:glycerophosphoryl diester phosphodiesterase|nr:glycerophosphodiester phosphodiesterase [Prevotellaceae bacterium]